MAYGANPVCVGKAAARPRRSRANQNKAVSECQTLVFPSDLGWMAAVWQADRLVRLAFGFGSRGAALLAVDQEKASGPGSLVGRRWGTFVERMRAVAGGANDDLRDIEVDLADRTDFQLAILRKCREIPRGHVRTYAELANLAGYAGAARAVGNVMATNRLPLVIPCHRVVGSGGKLGGFSAPQGLAMKVRLLKMEGARAHST